MAATVPARSPSSRQSPKPPPSRRSRRRRGSAGGTSVTAPATPPHPAHAPGPHGAAEHPVCESESRRRLARPLSRAWPTRPAPSRLRPKEPERPPLAPREPAVARAPTGNLARPEGPGGMLDAARRRRGRRRPSADAAADPRGPRPLPSPPIRPQHAGQPIRPAEAFNQHRPGRAAFTPPPMRPAVGRRPEGERRETPRLPQAHRRPPPPITGSITFVEGMTVKDLRTSSSSA